MLIRRALLTGLLAAPLVVRDHSILMPVRRLIQPKQMLVTWWERPEGGEWRHRAELVDMPQDFDMRSIARPAENVACVEFCPVV